MYKHAAIVHRGNAPPEFAVKVVKRCTSALQRQVWEAVRISRRSGEVKVMNSKTEYNRAKLPRIIIEEPEIDDSEGQDVMTGGVERERKNKVNQVNIRKWGEMGIKDKSEDGTDWLGNTSEADQLVLVVGMSGAEPGLVTED